MIVFLTKEINNCVNLKKKKQQKFSFPLLHNYYDVSLMIYSLNRLSDR